MAKRTARIASPIRDDGLIPVTLRLPRPVIEIYARAGDLCGLKTEQVMTMQVALAIAASTKSRV